MADLVDWDLARRVAGIGLGGGRTAMHGSPDLAAAGERSTAAVLAYTGLEPVEPFPAPEWASRSDWVAANLRSARELTAVVAMRLGAAGERQPLAAVARRVLAVEVGAMLGFASRHVLGQYEYPLLGGERPPRLIFVGENIDSAALQLGADPARVLDWIALHESTHAIQFAAAPWLRDHLGGLVRTLLAESPIRLPAREILDRPGGSPPPTRGACSPKSARRTRYRCSRPPSRWRRSTASRPRWRRSRATPTTSWTPPPTTSGPPSPSCGPGSMPGAATAASRSG